MTILVTGCAGFIGFHISKFFLNKKYKIVGIDSINNYYDTKIKKQRIAILQKNKNFKFLKGDLSKKNLLKKNVNKLRNVSYIIHLAGQAGVRYSFINPETYIINNILAYCYLLEFFAKKRVKNIFYASSSSIYGDISNAKKKMPNPLSIYASSKITMEQMSQIYSKNYNKNIIGLRFFTVYGPFGRPDMAYFKFLDLKKKKKCIEIYNYGKHKRSFTFIDDLSENFYKIFKYFENRKNMCTSKVYDIGNPNSITLLKFIHIYEKVIGSKFKKKFTKRQMGDVKNTFANIQFENRLFKYKFKTDLKKGLKIFFEWYKQCQCKSKNFFI